VRGSLTPHRSDEHLSQTNEYSYRAFPGKKLDRAQNRWHVSFVKWKNNQLTESGFMKQFLTIASAGLIALSFGASTATADKSDVFCAVEDSAGQLDLDLGHDKIMKSKGKSKGKSGGKGKGKGKGRDGGCSSS